jgi:3-dehydroquinate synthase
MPSSRTRVDVTLGSRSYPILIEPGLLADAGTLVSEHLTARAVLVISDERVMALHGRRLKDSLEQAGLRVHQETFPAGEEHKSIAQAERLWAACASHRLDRSGAVIALGGGISGDLAGFVAACWMRGVALVQIPTTLLAMVDSSVGGKTGVNSAGGKNLIGAFKQPHCVLIDPELLGTMEEREYRSGLAEVLKYGVIRDAAFFHWQEAHAEELERRDPDMVAYAVAQCCRIKADYVSEDEFEQGVRAQLNYGHTFGHALELDTHYTRYLHGEAVGLGMRMAANLAQILGLLTDPQLILRQDGLLTRYHLPLTHAVSDPAATAARLASHCRLDKKVTHGRTRFILPTGLGHVVMQEAPEAARVVEAFASALISG